jgi:hypothetical protein
VFSYIASCTRLVICRACCNVRIQRKQRLTVIVMGNTNFSEKLASMKQLGMQCSPRFWSLVHVMEASCKMAKYASFIGAR